MRGLAMGIVTMLVFVLLFSRTSYAPWIVLTRWTKHTYEGHISADWHAKLNLTDLLESNFTCLTYLILNFETSPLSEARLVVFKDYGNLTRWLKGFTAWFLILAAATEYTNGKTYIQLLSSPLYTELYLLIENVGDESFDYILDVKKSLICAQK